MEPLGQVIAFMLAVFFLEALLMAVLFVKKRAARRPLIYTNIVTALAVAAAIIHGGKADTTWGFLIAFAAIFAVAIPSALILTLALSAFGQREHT